MQVSILPILSYKQAFNTQMEDKLLRTSQLLTAQLDILKARDAGLLAGEDITKRATSTQQDFIKQAIEDIIDIRANLGITEAAGQNKPLEELFKIDTKV
ncbi:MAG: hypothetical protein CBB87_08920 [Micavibrio sp. TMED27]|nr:hypothetical protein [Micavibrio sp.]OUT90782.1 MAG: hypothetical protein CBB87_08920 [Micavibrio sp. TMED27]|tara:strand:+ start:1181 stop:1477 length:297 start_codon:yes stop_codon:yes gene_type:complete